MRRRPLSALAALSASALVLAACTSAPSTRDGSDPDRAAAEAAAAPVVTVVNPPVEETTDDGTAEAEQPQAGSDTGESSASEAGTEQAGTEQAGTESSADAEDAGEDSDGDASSTDPDVVHIAAGEKLELAVDGGEFTEVELIDVDHETVPVDTGTFDVAGIDDTDGAGEDTPAAESTSGTEDSSDTGAGSADGTADAEAGGSVDAGAQASGASTADASEASGADDSAPVGPQGTEWISSVDLVTSAAYQWTATTVAPDGSEHTATGVVTTPETTAVEELTAKTVITDGEEVGVGAPIIVMFNSTIPEGVRDDIEARLSVEVTDEDGETQEVEGSWAWLYDTDGISRVHYRPKEFWPANVEVSVNLPLKDVEYSDRWYGKEDVALDFQVGRDQRVTADAQTHRMKIERDGKEIADWPTSLGSPQAPSYNGTHVVMEKHAHYVMTSEQWDYETPTDWAVRIHNNGEFVHAAPWSVGSQGSANVSHGCINLSTERAKEYYDMALYGDPVEITGSSVDLTTNHSDISDWVYTWDEWQELSALN